MIDLDFDAWLKHGRESGWISIPVCLTHDGYPMSEAEEDEMEEDYDSCIHGLRLYADLETAQAVEANYNHD